MAEVPAGGDERSEHEDVPAECSRSHRVPASASAQPPAPGTFFFRHPDNGASRSVPDAWRLQQHFEEFGERLALFEQRVEVWNSEQRQRLECALQKDCGLERRLEEWLVRLQTVPIVSYGRFPSESTVRGGANGKETPRTPVQQSMRSIGAVLHSASPGPPRHPGDEEARVRSRPPRLTTQVAIAARTRVRASPQRSVSPVATAAIIALPAIHSGEQLEVEELTEECSSQQPNGFVSGSNTLSVNAFGANAFGINACNGSEASAGEQSLGAPASPMTEGGVHWGDAQGPCRLPLSPAKVEKDSEPKRQSQLPLMDEKLIGHKVVRAESSKMRHRSRESRFSQGFDYFFTFLIMLNSAFIGAQTEYRMQNIGEYEEPSFFKITEYVFAACFLVELCIRVAMQRAKFVRGRDCLWNLFDLVLVTMSIVDVCLEAVSRASAAGGLSDTPSKGSGSAGKVVRMFRMARIIRIIRVLRFLAELRVMMTLIVHSMRSLFWLMILLLLILYVFACMFTQGVAEYFEGCAPEGELADCEKGEYLFEYYGGMLPSAYTLFCTITGGLPFDDVLRPLALAGWGYIFLFIVYVFFCVFSVLNIVTGVFVDGAIQRSNQERDLRLEKEREQKEMYVSMLRDLLEDIDAEGKGAITREELFEAFKDERVRHYFSVLDIDIADSNYLFDMLDLDGSGEVDMDEFVSGCLRLKGNAKSIDVHTLMYEIKSIIRKWDVAMERGKEDTCSGVATIAEGVPRNSKSHSVSGTSSEGTSPEAQLRRRRYTQHPSETSATRAV